MCGWPSFNLMDLCPLCLTMYRLRFKLREVEVLASQETTTTEANRKVGITEQTYYRWRREYGGIKIEQAKRITELEKAELIAGQNTVFLFFQ